MVNQRNTQKCTKREPNATPKKIKPPQKGEKKTTLPWSNHSKGDQKKKLAIALRVGVEPTYSMLDDDSCLYSSVLNRIRTAFGFKQRIKSLTIP